jgi:hypothetical protein
MVVSSRVALAHRLGIILASVTRNRIGANGGDLDVADERKIVSGNASLGISISGSGNVVAGNDLGTDATGEFPATR